MIKVQINCSNKFTNQQLQSIRGMGVHYLAANFPIEDANYKKVKEFQQRAAKFNLIVADAGCPQLQKCPAIDLGKSDRDQWINRYNEFTKVLGAVGIPVNYLAWQPNGIFRTKIGIGKYTHGQNAFICDFNEIKKQSLINGREYSEKEIWDNFEYFLERALPTSEKANVKLALHPNDPPVESVGGTSCLICSSDSYRKAFSLANNSPYLGMKLCTGCWLENKNFGDLLSDIRYFQQEKKILVVHFRNVSTTIPYFEETLLEDGYANMLKVAEQLIKVGYDGQINIDHPFFNTEKSGGSPLSEAYLVGYMKGLLHSAQQIVSN